MSGPLLRAGVLDGVRVVVHGGDGAALAALGADVTHIAPDLADDEGAVAAARELGPVDVVVCDARAAFGDGGHPGLRAALDGAFLAARAVFAAAFAEGGRVVLVAPAPGAGEHARAARAGLENLARTLGTEWARLGVTVTAVMPGDATSAEELDGVLGFLCSAAGGYHTGCALTLR